MDSAAAGFKSEGALSSERKAKSSSQHAVTTVTLTILLSNTHLSLIHVFLWLPSLFLSPSLSYTLTHIITPLKTVCLPPATLLYPPQFVSYHFSVWLLSLWNNIRKELTVSRAYMHVCVSLSQVSCHQIYTERVHEDTATKSTGIIF